MVRSDAQHRVSNHEEPHRDDKQEMTAASIPVLIAGAGPVGLTLAAELAWRGVASVVVDPQA